MEKKRRKGGYFLLSVTIILSLVMISIMLFCMPYKGAEAIISTSPTVKIGELLQEGYEDKPLGSKAIFNADNL